MCPWWQLALGPYLILLFVVINVLNLIWFNGILKHVKRNFQKAKPKESEYNSESELEPLLPENGPSIITGEK